MFDWMAWTLPVAVFFISIVLMLIGMTVWEIKSPTTERRGFLPIATTRGDRLFIGLLSAAWLNLAFVAVSEKMIDCSASRASRRSGSASWHPWPCWPLSCARASVRTQQVGGPPPFPAGRSSTPEGST